MNIKREYLIGPVLQILLIGLVSPLFSQSIINTNMNQEKVVMIVVAQINPAEQAALKSYLEASGPIFKQVGAQAVHKYKVAGQLVGNIDASLISIVEFPSQEILENVFDSNEYKALLADRNKAFIKLDVYFSK